MMKTIGDIAVEGRRVLVRADLNVPLDGDRITDDGRIRASLPTLTAKLQVSHLRTFFPTPWEEQVNIPYVEANLIAVKDGLRQGGPLLC